MRLSASSIFLLAPLIPFIHAQQAVPAAQPVAAAPVAAAPVAAAPVANAAADPDTATAVTTVTPAAAVPAAPVAPIPGVGGGAGPVQTVPAGQAPIVTTGVAVVTAANGQIQNIPTVYTQTFPVVATQGPSPVPGNIGLGTLTGQVGALKTDAASQGSSGGRGMTLSSFELVMGVIGLVGLVV